MLCRAADDEAHADFGPQFGLGVGSLFPRRNSHPHPQASASAPPHGPPNGGMAAADLPGGAFMRDELPEPVQKVPEEPFEQGGLGLGSLFAKVHAALYYGSMKALLRLY